MILLALVCELEEEEAPLGRMGEEALKEGEGV